VMGVDPGMRLTGFGCVETPRRGTTLPLTRSRDAALVDAGVIRLDVDLPIADRLVQLEREFVALLDELKPELVGIESLYAHVEHPATSIVMGHGRGVLLLATRRAGISLVELKATEIKKSLTGFGHAGKGQMQGAIKYEFSLAIEPKPADVADGLAIALAALRRRELA